MANKPWKVEAPKDVMARSYESLGSALAAAILTCRALDPGAEVFVSKNYSYPRYKLMRRPRRQIEIQWWETGAQHG